MPRLSRLAHLANRRYQIMVGARYGIRWLPNYRMGQDPIPQGGLLSLDSPIRDLIPEMRDLQPAENPFPFPYVRQFYTMMIEPNTYLPAVMQDFRIAGGQIKVQEFRNLAELQTLPQRVIVNCTGLGAKMLFGDDELTPVKGQLTILLPQPEIQYCHLAGRPLHVSAKRRNPAGWHARNGSVVARAGPGGQAAHRCRTGALLPQMR